MGFLRAGSGERGRMRLGWVYSIAIRSAGLAGGFIRFCLRAAEGCTQARGPPPQPRPNLITSPTGNPGLQQLVGEQLEEPKQKYGEERAGQYQPERLPPVHGGADQTNGELDQQYSDEQGEDRRPEQLPSPQALFQHRHPGGIDAIVEPERMDLILSDPAAQRDLVDARLPVATDLPQDEARDLGLAPGGAALALLRLDQEIVVPILGQQPLQHAPVWLGL